MLAWSKQPPGLRRCSVSRIHMHAVKSGSLHQVNAIIENQLHLSRRQHRAKNRRIGQHLGLGAGFIPVFEQRHARLGQLAAQPPQKLRAPRLRNHSRIENRINLRKRKRT